jgi:hypothetical protein
MANIIQNLIDKGISTFNCKLIGQKIYDNRPGCIKCAASYAKQHEACISAVKAIAKTKTKTEKTPSRIPGYWGYAQGSFTDIFCNAICQKPLTMNQIAAIIDPKSQEPIGPHPKAKKRLIAENLATFDGHFIYMRVWPKGHAEAGKLTPAAKIAKTKTESKTESKAA